MEAARHVASSLTHRVLLSPVTHLSPFNDGKPHSPRQFARRAAIVQEK
ncbi:unnamed protein product, partial [Discosporangium mesarthrocarpum]